MAFRFAPGKILAFNAVDAAFAGYSGVVMGQVNTHFAILPTPVVVQAPRRVDPYGACASLRPPRSAA